MSASRRRKSTRPARENRDAEFEPTEEELETLEELDELDELEEEDASMVTVRLGPSDEVKWDLCLEVEVPDMEKSAVPAAVEGPLARKAREVADQIRWRRVIVRFSGSAMIPSAIKDVVASALAPVMPWRVIVQRGYPNEIVHDAEPPRVQVTTELVGQSVTAAIDTGEIEPRDLPWAIERELERLCIGAQGRRYTLMFGGRTRPDTPVLEQIRAALDAAGAVRAEITDEDGSASVLFDHELEEMVHVVEAPDAVDVRVKPDPDEAVTCSALDLALSGARDKLAGNNVRVRFENATPRDRELAKLVEIGATVKPSRIELMREGAEPDVLWPPLLRVAARDDRALIGVRDTARGRDAWLGAFRREAAGLEDVVRERHLTVDWPAGFALDEEIEKACLTGALGALGPRSVAFTFGGQDREPFAPPAITCRIENDDLRVIHLDTDAGKPPELARAIERHLARLAPDLAGHPVRVEVVGAGALSRTMLRSLRESVEAAGATRLELDDHGDRDVLFPSLLAIVPQANGVIRIAADPTGRDEPQVDTAMDRELEAAELASGATYDLAPSPINDKLVAALIAREAGRIRIEGEPLEQVHPVLFAPPEREGGGLLLTARPDAEEQILVAQVERELPPIVGQQGPLDAVEVTLVWPGAHEPFAPAPARALDILLAAAPKKLSLDDAEGHVQQLHPEVKPEYVVVLGRKEDAAPPLVMLGILAGKSDEHVAGVIGALDAIRGDLEGRRVLLLLRHRAKEFVTPDDHPLVIAVRGFVDPLAAATLVRRRDHFEVVHSALDDLPVGKKVRDPRSR